MSSEKHYQEWLESRERVKGTDLQEALRELGHEMRKALGLYKVIDCLLTVVKKVRE